MKGGYAYIMASGPHGTLYVGHTANVARRVWQHKNANGSDFCQENGCLTLVYYKTLGTIQEAMAREKAIKAWNAAGKPKGSAAQIRHGAIYTMI
jgi:putative endonuclease